jgi:hypothetical protein
MQTRRPEQPRDFHSLVHVARERTRSLTTRAASRDEVNDAALAARRAAMAGGRTYATLVPLVHDAEVALTRALDDEKGRADLVTNADDLLGTVLGHMHATEPD